MTAEQHKWRDRLVPIALALLTAISLIYLSFAELSRRTSIAREFSRIDAFINSGPRFTLEYGILLCEHLRALELEHDLPDPPIDCKLIRATIHGASMANGEWKSE